jgi:hypothetical protein
VTLRRFGIRMVAAAIGAAVLAIRNGRGQRRIELRSLPASAHRSKHPSEPLRFQVLTRTGRGITVERGLGARMPKRARAAAADDPAAQVRRSTQLLAGKKNGHGLTCLRPQGDLRPWALTTKRNGIAGLLSEAKHAFASSPLRRKFLDSSG